MVKFCNLALPCLALLFVAVPAFAQRAEGQAVAAVTEDLARIRQVASWHWYLRDSIAGGYDLRDNFLIKNEAVVIHAEVARLEDLPPTVVQPPAAPSSSACRATTPSRCG
jgi:hypothetical protein